MPACDAAPPAIKSPTMLAFIGVMRIYEKHAALLLAVGLVLQIASSHSRAQQKPARPRITGIDHVRIYVTDTHSSSSFYQRLMGVHAAGRGCTDASLPCFTVGWRRRQSVQLQKVPSPDIKNWLAEIAFSTEDVARLREYVISAGVSATAISKASCSAHFEMRDPEGTPVSFIQRSCGVLDEPAGYLSEPQIRVGFLHAGFVVKDIAAENKFYRDLLGFKLYWHGGFKDDGLDWYEIQVPDGSDWIEYMLNIPANADHKELGVQNHFSLGVKDIHAAAEQLRKNGLLKFDGPEIGRDGKWGLDAYDPDGTRVEFMEPTPAREPCCHAYTAPHPQL
jgi:catechol 2,3-dioxygenase-like lactoylglutathione lyase family enzyme